MLRTLLVAAVFLAGCSGPSDSPRPTTPDQPGACAADGWPQPQGEIDERCQAVDDGCCYPSPAAACAAAGCAPESCQIMKSFPAQVRCAAGG